MDGFKSEKDILKFWDSINAFEKQLEKTSNYPEYVFYDGPPFANGLPHYGHLLTGFVKDIIPRYQTMKGNKVDRRFGWDCHGLPAEMESEKELGISGRKQIQDFGVENFNDHCRTSVMRYTKEWEGTVGRQARWVDFENDYKTMDLSYMESVIWAFKQLWDKGLVYEKDRVMPYSWKAETPLSNFETRLDDSYRERKDPAVTVKFEIKESIPCGDECANFADITNKINGAEIKTKMIVIYRVNSDNKIVSLRAFWDFQAMENQMNKLFSGD